jgi:hypothetical protein
MTGRTRAGTPARGRRPRRLPTRGRDPAGTIQDGAPKLGVPVRPDGLVYRACWAVRPDDLVHRACPATRAASSVDRRARRIEAPAQVTGAVRPLAPLPVSRGAVRPQGSSLTLLSGRAAYAPTAIPEINAPKPLRSSRQAVRPDALRPGFLLHGTSRGACRPGWWTGACTPTGLASGRMSLCVRVCRWAVRPNPARPGLGLGRTAPFAGADQVGPLPP